MDQAITEIKQKLSIVDFIGRYVTLKKAGKHYTGLCPFHQEKSPSFVVSPDREMWYCFGACHEGGDIFNFFMKYENISFYEALQELARETGVKLEDVKVSDQDWSKKDALYKVNEMAQSFYHHVLHNTKFGERSREYLRKRGLNEKIIETFGLGYAPDSWDSLLKFLRKRKVSDEMILKVGLAVQGGRNGMYDRFRSRLIFPIKDIRDNIIGFSGRLLEDKEGQPKYINVPETEIYKKRESLYGIHVTKDAIRKKESVIVVEGEFDVITPYQHGIDNVVAIKGSSVTREHLKILKRYAPRVILSLDADAAGNDAIIRAIQDAELIDLELMVLKIPGGKDPDEAAREHEGALKEALKHCIPAADFILEAVAAKHPENSPFAKKKIVDELVGFLHAMRNVIVQEYYIKKLAALVDSSPESIKMEMEESVKKNDKVQIRNRVTQSRKEDPLIENQKYLMSFVIQHEEPLSTGLKVFGIMKPSDFTLPALQKIAEHFLDYHKDKENFNEKVFTASIPNELTPMYDEIAYTLIPEIAFREDPLRLAIVIKRKLLKQKSLDAQRIQNEDEREQVLQYVSTELIRIGRIAV